MRLGSAWVSLAAAAAILASACTESGDIGYPCVLVKSDGDGGTVQIYEGELAPNRDILSIGAIECEDFYCVRHRGTEPTQATDENGNPIDPNTIPARGVCTRPCVVTNERSCDAVHPTADLTDGPFSCRPLVLDPETLADVCDDPNPPPICGATTQSTYCAQGGTPADAGT